MIAAAETPPQLEGYSDEAGPLDGDNESTSEDTLISISWDDVSEVIGASYAVEIVKFSWTSDMNCISRRRWTQVVHGTYPRLQAGEADGRQLFDAFPDFWTLRSCCMDYLRKVQAERKDRGLSEDDAERLLFILQYSARPILAALQIARVYQEYEEEAMVESSKAAFRNKAKYFLGIATAMANVVPTGPSFVCDRAQFLGKRFAGCPLDEAITMRDNKNFLAAPPCIQYCEDVWEDPPFSLFGRRALDSTFTPSRLVHSPKARFYMYTASTVLLMVLLVNTASSAYVAVRNDHDIARDGWYYSFLVMVIAMVVNEIKEWYRSIRAVSIAQQLDSDFSRKRCGGCRKMAHALGLDHAGFERVQEALTRYISIDYWNALDTAMTIGFFLVVFFDWVQALELMATVCIILIVPAFLRLAHVFEVSRVLGPLVRSVLNMANDIAVFMGVFSLVLVSFVITFSVLFSDVDEYANFSSTAYTLYSASLGDFEFDPFDNPVVEEEWRSVLGKLLMIAFTAVSHIVLLNLLIAIMGSTYERFKDASEVEYRVGRGKTVIRFQHAVYDDDLPPPLNLVAYFIWVFVVIYAAICAAVSTEYSQRKRIIKHHMHVVTSYLIYLTFIPLLLPFVAIYVLGVATMGLVSVIVTFIGKIDPLDLVTCKVCIVCCKRMDHPRRRARMAWAGPVDEGEEEEESAEGDGEEEEEEENEEDMEAQQRGAARLKSVVSMRKPRLQQKKATGTKAQGHEDGEEESEGEGVGNTGGQPDAQEEEVEEEKQVAFAEEKKEGPGPAALVRSDVSPDGAAPAKAKAVAFASEGGEEEAEEGKAGAAGESQARVWDTFWRSIKYMAFQTMMHGLKVRTTGPNSQIRKAMQDLQQGRAVPGWSVRPKEGADAAAGPSGPGIRATASFWRSAGVQPSVQLRWYSMPIENSTLNVELQKIMRGSGSSREARMAVVEAIYTLIQRSQERRMPLNYSALLTSIMDVLEQKGETEAVTQLRHYVEFDGYKAKMVLQSVVNSVQRILRYRNRRRSHVAHLKVKNKVMKRLVRSAVPHSHTDPTRVSGQKSTTEYILVLPLVNAISLMQRRNTQKPAGSPGLLGSASLAIPTAQSRTKKRSTTNAVSERLQGMLDTSSCISPDGVDVGYVLREIPLSRFMLKSWMLDAMHQVAGKGAEFGMEGVGDEILDDMAEKSEFTDLHEQLEDHFKTLNRKVDRLKKTHKKKKKSELTPIFQEARVRGAAETIRTFVKRAVASGTPFDTIFEAFDVNGDNVVTLPDLNVVLPEFCLNLTEHEKMLLMQAFNNGASTPQCSYEDFRRFIGRVGPGSPRSSGSPRSLVSPKHSIAAATPTSTASAAAVGETSTQTLRHRAVAAGLGAPPSVGAAAHVTTLPPIAGAAQALPEGGSPLPAAQGAAGPSFFPPTTAEGGPVVQGGPEPAIATQEGDTTQALSESEDLDTSKDNTYANPLESRVSSILNAAATMADVAPQPLGSRGSFRDAPPASMSPHKYHALQRQMNEVKTLVQQLLQSNAGEGSRGQPPYPYGPAPGPGQVYSPELPVAMYEASPDHRAQRRPQLQQPVPSASMPYERPPPLHTEASFRRKHGGLWSPDPSKRASGVPPGTVQSPDTLSEERRRRRRKKKGKSKERSRVRPSPSGDLQEASFTVLPGLLVGLGMFLADVRGVKRELALIQGPFKSMYSCSAHPIRAPFL